MNANVLILSALLAVCLGGGLALVRFLHVQRERQLVRSRLSGILDQWSLDVQLPAEDGESQWIGQFLGRLPWLAAISASLELSGLNLSLTGFAALSLGLLLAPAAVAVLTGLPLVIFLVIGLILGAAPYLVLRMVTEQKRNRFVEQLPDAIDLMISVLRSGLSIPQAVKAVSDEMPSPCGPEFGDVLHRMNLGQSLPEALVYTVDRFQLFELDLIRRATAIQMEIGGSLADLLEKTNNTLRQRIKLKRTIRVLTAQSRLAGKIICAMPFIIAFVFELINPGYLRPLYETNIGKLFVVLAIFFQIAGALAIRRLSSFKI